MATRIVTTNSDSGVDNITDTDLATDMSDGCDLSLRKAIGNVQSDDPIAFDLDRSTEGLQSDAITFAYHEQLVINSKFTTNGDVDGDSVAGVTASAFPTSLLVNTDPSLDTVPEEEPTFTEGDEAMYLASSGRLSDSDGDADWDGGTLVIQITGNNTDADEIGIQDSNNDSIDISVSGTDLLAGGVTVGTLSASGGTVSGGTALTITFGDSATNDIVQEVLRSVTYENTSDDPSTLTRTVTVTATDANNGSATEDKPFDVEAVEDVPEVSATALDPTFTQYGSAKSLFSGVTMDPIEAGQTIAGFTLYVDGVVDEGDEYLYISDITVALVDGRSASFQSGLSYSVSATSSGMNVVFSFSNWSQSRVEDFVEGITYRNTADSPTVADTRTFYLSNISDSGDGMASGGIGSTVTVVLDEGPTLTGTPTDIHVEIEEASNIDLSAATLADEDSDLITIVLSVDTGTLTATRVSGLKIGSSDLINGREGMRIEGQAPSASPSEAIGATLTISGTIENINTYLSDPSNIRYTSATGVKGDDAATLTIQTGYRGRDPEILATVNLDIGTPPGNQAPSAAQLDSTTVQENVSGAVVGRLSASDADGDSVSFILTDQRFEVVDGVLKLKDGISLDYEAEATVRIGINAFDGEHNGTKKFFWLTVEDADEDEPDSGGDPVVGSDGPDAITGSAGGDEIEAGDGRDTVESGEGDDSVSGGGDDDLITSGDGRDTVDGGTGDDDISGGNDDDQLFGGAGDDTVDGGTGVDTLRGGEGNDRIMAGGDDDLVYAGVGDDGADTVEGADGNDSLGGGAGNDSLTGDGGDDLIWGNAGDDIINGGDGDDILHNGAGDDTVSGGAGDDTLWAGDGDDTLTGGDGADNFVFGAQSGSDTVTDFDAAEDSLSFVDGTTFSAVEDVIAAASDATQGGVDGVMIELAVGESVFIAGLGLDELGGVTMTF
ncbi:calcium-binding protein [Kordiimonas aestuarii]|uniref:calcium-binding protein n=1 Tax=Kordiimonas aestuarii TaxID=1005925 RepID=UPI0021D268A3|nr:calcium-binding protein [Kordiimonas aestuarii]